MLKLGYCAVAFLTLAARIFLKDHNMYLEVNGPLLTIGAIFGLLTGGLTIYNHLEERLRETSSWGTPEWCDKLLLKTINSEMIWGSTKGRPRHNRESNLALDEPALEPETVLEEPLLEDESVATSSQVLLTQVRDVIIEVGTVILQLAYQSGNSWGTVNHAGFRPFNSLGFDRALEMWPLMAGGSIGQWSRGKWFCPVPLIPQNGLTTKVLLDRVMELWVDAGLGSSHEFLRNYGNVPLIPTIGGTPRLLSVLQCRSALCGSDGLPTKHPPQLLLQTMRDLQKQLRKLDSDVLLTWPMTENLLCCTMKILDRINGITIHAPY